MNRRSLFKAVGFGIAIAAAPVAFAKRHFLIPDGKTDNSEAFDAFMRGELVYNLDGSPAIEGRTIYFGKGTYSFERPPKINVPNVTIVVGQGARLKFKSTHDGGPLFHFGA